MSAIGGSASGFWPSQNLPVRMDEAIVRRIVREELERALGLESLLSEVKGMLDE